MVMKKDKKTQMNLELKVRIQKELVITQCVAYQYIAFLKNEISYEQFMLNAVKERKDSEVVWEEAFIDWLIREEDNDLPFQSSGSTWTAITDLDNLICNFEEEMDGEEELYDVIEKQHDEIFTPLDRIVFGINK